MKTLKRASALSRQSTMNKGTYRKGCLKSSNKDLDINSFEDHTTCTNDDFKL
eukprot:Pgem_evm1s13104